MQVTQAVQIISTVVFYVWMFAMLFFLWKIWRNSIVTAQAWETLTEVAIKAADTAQESAKAASALAAEKPVI